MNNCVSIDKYKTRFFISPRLADKIIYNSGNKVLYHHHYIRITYGDKSIASKMYEKYFNLRKASENNANFYDPRRHDYYIICKNKEFLDGDIHLNKNAINIGKIILYNFNLLHKESQDWNKPDRLYLPKFNKIYNSVKPKKSNFSYSNGQTSGGPESKHLLQENSISKRKYNHKNIQLDIQQPKAKSTQKLNSRKPKADVSNNYQNLRGWATNVANVFDTHADKNSKKHGKTLARDMVQISGKKYKVAHKLFHLLTSLTHHIPKNHHVYNVNFEDVPGTEDFLEAVKNIQLNPKFKFSTKATKYYYNYIKKSFIDFLTKFIVQYKYNHSDDFAKKWNRLHEQDDDEGNGRWKPKTIAKNLKRVEYAINVDHKIHEYKQNPIEFNKEFRQKTNMEGPSIPLV